jgi:TP901 family phage tail tape measure protein
MGALWLSYAKMIPVLVAFAGATKGVKDSITTGMESQYATAMITAIDSNGGLQGEAFAAQQTETYTRLINVSRESVHTVQENAEALRQLSLAGIDAERGINLLATASDAAIFAGEDLSKTTLMITDALYNFGMASNDPAVMAENFTKMADIMTYTANSVNASFSDISKSFGNITGVAGLFNVEVEEAAVLLQALAKTGVRGPKAGTYVRNFLDELLGSPNNARGAEWLERNVGRYDPAQGGKYSVSKYIDKLK